MRRQQVLEDDSFADDAYCYAGTGAAFPAMTTGFLAWAALAFLCGACPFSVWIGRLVLHRDICAVGDGNPGATNVLLAGGRYAAAIALLLDILKGAIPVALAKFLAGFQGWPLAAIALLPILGHAFTPFLGGRGGKAVAVSVGVWGGLTSWVGAASAGLLLSIGFLFFGVSGWAVMAAMAGLLFCILFLENAWAEPPLLPDTWVLLGVWLGNLGVFIWKQRADLASRPAFRWRKKPPG